MFLTQAIRLGQRRKNKTASIENESDNELAETAWGFASLPKLFLPVPYFVLDNASVLL